MEYEQWLGILTSINADNDLNESNIIKKIGEKLEKENPDTYQEWQDNQCGVNYTLSDSQLTLLHTAAANGLAKLTELLIKKEADVNKANQYGWAPLHCAAADGRTEIVKALIEKGAIVNAAGEDKWTPLHHAAVEGHTEIVKTLIEKGADVNAAGEDKWTPLHHAAVEGHTEIVKTLIEKGADVNAVGEDNYTPLYLAVENGHTEVIKALIEKGADVNAVDKCALLRFAAKIGRTEMVKALIEKGVNVNAVDIMGYTSLHFAAKNGHTEVVKALIEKGAIVEVVDINGHRYTPLHFAAQMGHTEIVNVLIENVANVNVLSESDKVTPLYLAVQNGHAETVKALMKKGANPLLENKSYRTLKRLTELIKNNHLPKKAEKTTTGEQVDDEYELLKYSLLFRNGCPLIDNVRRDAFDNLLCTWFADVSGLTQEQKELNKKLLSILKDLSYLSDRDENILRNFLRENKDDDDLEYILNLPRGESGLTILHVISSMDGKLAEKYVNLLLEAGADPNKKDDRGKTPLHYASCNNIGSLIKAGADPNVQDSEKRTPLHCAAGIGDEKSVNIFLEHGADSSKKDKQEKTPLQVATDNHNYHVEMHFLTDNQKRLFTELGRIVDAEDFFTDFTELKRFLSKYKSTQDLKRILNLRDYQGKSEILLNLRIVFYSRHFRDCEAPYEEAKRLLLEAEAIDYERLDRKEHSPEPGTLWDNLILNQQQKLKMFLGEVGAAQDMKKLEQVVNKAIESGVRFNFLIHPGKMMYQDTYNFTDCVMKKISALKKSSKVENDIEVASGIVCKLVSKGAVLHNLSSIDVIDTLESEFKDHKTNMKKAHEEYVNNTLEFMEIVKSATNGKVKNAKIDNSTFYLEYSENSKIDVAKITDGARDLGLTQGEIEYGRDIIKIGKSEVEIITQKGIRNYTDLTEGSDIVLTFYTSLGNIDVRLYPDVQDKSKIIVEVSNREEVLEKFKGHEEELGEDCALGDYDVYYAIEQGYFERSGKLMHPEVISESNNKWTEREELRRDSMEEIARRHKLLQDLRNIESNIVKKEKNFDVKTYLIDIFKILSRFYEEKGDISKTDLAKAAEKESKKLGLEGKYNWSKIFSLEEEIIEKAEKQGDKEQKSNIPDDFYLGHAINNGSCFFDSFRQSLEQQKGIKVTVEQLRNECKRFAQDNPPEWFISKIGNDFDEVEGEFVNRGITCNQYINSIGKNEFWGRSDIEGRILCDKYGVKLHVAESNPLHTIDKQQDPFLHQLIDSSGSKAGKIDYSHNSVLHMVNGGHDHFQPLLYRNKALAKQTQEQKDSLCYSSLPSCSMDELKIEKASHQQKALLVRRP